MSPFDPQWASQPSPQGGNYSNAVWVAALLAIDPNGLGGLSLRAWPGPRRDEYLHGMTKLFGPTRVFRKVPLHVTDDRLLGGIDLAATLQAGKPVTTSGLLAEARDGVLLLSMAERLSAGTAARLAAATDCGAGFAMIALDEGVDVDEAPPKPLLDRLAFLIGAPELPDENSIWPHPSQIATARENLANIETGPEIHEQICTLAVLFGIPSLRVPLFALRAARAAAALQGRQTVLQEDITLVTSLVLVPRATQMPSLPQEQPAESPEDTPEPDAQNEDIENAQPFEDSVAETVLASLPPDILAALAMHVGQKSKSRGAGKSGGSASLKRGRPIGARHGGLKGDARLSLIETLRAAAPWQKLRRQSYPGQRVVIRADDFRIRRFKEQARTIAIFAVDASGSSAVNRLAEAKGAIQLLLADCYVRRDQVALVAFRGQGAECLLPPTHALARAKRALAALPGGGPTPLATGIATARELAEAERRKGHVPLVVLLTDGGANIGRDGNPGRAAAADALAAGRLCRAANIATLIVDTAPRPQAFVAKLAAGMGGRYLPLPYADAARLSAAVKQQGGANA